MTTRRYFLLGTTAVALAGCAGATPVVPPAPPVPSTLQTIADDIQLAATALNDVLSYVPMTAVTRARYQGYVTQVVDGARALLSAADNASAQGIVKQVVSAIQAALDIVSGMTGLPSSVTTAITAIRVILPILGTFAGLFMAAPRSSMSPEQARATLRAFTARR